MAGPTLNLDTVRKKARIEIIPLIDIMFFLLAAFMLVSLSMVNLKSVKVNLPTATAATADAQRVVVRRDARARSSGGATGTGVPLGVSGDRATSPSHGQREAR